MDVGIEKKNGNPKPYNELVLQLAKHGQIIESTEDVVKDLYIFEFLKRAEALIN